MNEFFKQLFKAPWSNQKVGLLARLLAFLFLAFGLFTVCTYAYLVIFEGLSISISALDVVTVIAIIYMTLLFGRVALTGKAPKGWLPWR